MKPIIGIACGQMWQGNRETLYVHKLYSEAIISASGLPILLPLAEIENATFLDIIDGLLLPGGADIDPAFYNENPLPGLGNTDYDKDVNDLSLCKKALEINMPVLGICRGLQVLNVAGGGSLFQDLKTQLNDIIKHDQNQNYYHPIHKVIVKKESLVYKIFQKAEFRVNSSHHQAVKKLAPGFIASAFATDGVVEAIESLKHDFVLGLQWHPEWLAKGYPEMLKPFKAFCDAALRFGRR